MYVKKILNIMYSNVSSPDKKWCKEAYEHADIIIWIDGMEYYRVSTNELNKNAYFASILPGSTSVQIYRLIVDYNNYTISYLNKVVNYE